MAADTRRKSAPPPALPVLARPALHGGLIVLACLLAFFPVLRAGFLTWDDADNFAANPAFHPPTAATIGRYWHEPHMNLYVPVTYTVWGALAIASYDADRASFSPAAFHAANLLLHALAALVVWRVLRRLTGAADKSAWPALLGALVFAVHPAQVESVGWASGTKDVLAGGLTWAAVWQFLRSCGATRPRARRGSYALATALAALAMLAKPSAVVAPVVAGVVAIGAARHPWRRTAALLLPWVALSILCALKARQVQPPATLVYQPPAHLRPLVATDALAFYLGKLTWPAGLTVDHGRRPQDVLAGSAAYTWLVPAGAAVALGVASRRLRRREAAAAAAPAETAARPSLAGAIVAGALVTVVCLGPTLGLVSFDFQQYSTVAEHYLYSAMGGVALAAAAALGWAMGLAGKTADAVRRGGPLRAGPAWLAAGVIGALVVRSNVQARVWENNVTLFAHAVDVNPASRPGHNSLAIALVAAGRPADALPHARRAADLDPADPKAWLTLSNAHRALGQTDAAVRAADRALAIVPDEPVFVSHAGSLYGVRAAERERRGDRAGAATDAAVALRLLSRAVDLAPNASEAHLNLGTFLVQSDRYDQAIPELRKAIDLDPRAYMARANLGAVLLERGEVEEARRQFEETLRVRPGWPLAVQGLAEIRRRTGR